ncbi:hypothetical protein [Mariniradius saccharolyticus]|uniref:hypothetical protein n=1 Tax=Mariniradius saccharolyticus TaxID=1245591 RepID=UPI0012F6C0BB|nr:hypothetical protein [Mariniradius saccharolyticus]
MKLFRMLLALFAILTLCMNSNSPTISVNASSGNFLKMPEPRLCISQRRYYTVCGGWGAGCHPHSCDDFEE